MKRFEKFKLNQLSKVELEERELQLLMGGCNGTCGCRSGNTANADANYKYKYHVPGGGCVPKDYNGGTLPEVNITPTGPC